MSTVLFSDVGQIVTCESADERSVRARHALAAEDGCIAAIGPPEELVARYPRAERVRCAGGVITPGFVDSHTHAVFGCWRAGEYALRARGVPYMEIARQGGGINASVRDLRARSEDELVQLTRARLREMLRQGITTAEVKSGYGLRTEDELKSLRVVKRLNEEGPLELVPTFMGAHEFPAETRGRRSDYVHLVIQEMIPAVAEAKLAVFCDVFLEPGVFTAVEARRILEAGLARGLLPKLHADELEPSGGAELAVALGAVSADHLGRISDAGIHALAHSQTVATLLPATLFFLGHKQYAPGRRLLDAGATVALATDFNPGSAPSPNMALVLTLACSHMGFDPLEALLAATAGGARALRIEDGRGALRPGAPADLIVWGVSDYREIPYRYGVNMIRGVWKRGVRVV
ncbi:MAG: imidazolonepropionase [Gemmatimonadetes bacterium]|nr:imidazolonepropionase [Gemmatimonadota bacterium]